MDPGWLVTGATGLVGGALMAAASDAGVRPIGTSREGRWGTLAMDLREAGAAVRLLEAVNPRQVVHLAAIAKPAEVDARRDDAGLVNVTATREIARWCAERGRHLAFASTDHVFGHGRGPYREGDAAFPVNAYGRMKLEAERAVLAAGGLVVRLGWVLDDSPGSRSDYIGRALGRLREGARVSAVDDEWRTPIHTSDLGRMLCRLVLDRRVGTIHPAGSAHATPYRLLMAKAREQGLDVSLIEKASRKDLLPGDRPGDVRLNTSLLRALLRRECPVDA